MSTICESESQFLRGGIKFAAEGVYMQDKERRMLKKKSYSGGLAREITRRQVAEGLEVTVLAEPRRENGHPLSSHNSFRISSVEYRGHISLTLKLSPHNSEQQRHFSRRLNSPPGTLNLLGLEVYEAIV
jgi:hypothetical protein